MANLAAAQIYVDGDVATPGTGTSWSDPYKNLQPALDEAAAALDGGMIPQDIWVKAIRGKYRPTAFIGQGGPRERAFHVHSGTRVYGGFDGSEQSFDQRANLFRSTVLTGDFLNTPSITSDDAYTVVFVDSDLFFDPDGMGRPRTTVIDGFAIQDGRADGAMVGFADEQSHGGGMYIYASPTTVRNCQFSNNYAAESGGGLHVDAANDEQQIGVGIDRCQFQFNRANKGGAMSLVEMGSYVADDYIGNTFIYNCIVNRNYAENGAMDEGQGGGIWFGSRDAREVLLCNSQIVGNLSEGRGSAIYFGKEAESHPPITQVYISHCTIAQNRILGSLEGYALYYEYPASSFFELVTNSIIYDNVDPNVTTGQSQIGVLPPPSSLQVESCDVEGGYPGIGNIDMLPFWVGGGNFRLLQNSPCIDVGSAAHILPDRPDLNGNGDVDDPVPFDWTAAQLRVIGTATDMGAFEYGPPSF